MYVTMGYREDYWGRVKAVIGAEGRIRTDTGLLPPVFETGASTIPPLRLVEVIAAVTPNGNAIEGRYV